jgi:predicted glycosyltransferase
VWIDLANSPHPLLFAPVATRLRELGHEVTVTVRDNAQTLELARARWPDARCVGGASPAGMRVKGQAMLDRVGRLRRWAVEHRPDVALSHNSYGQIAAAWTLGIPTVTAMDYEHQPANHLAFRMADRILLPDALPLRAVRRYGARERKVIRYPGLKEELYLGEGPIDTEIVSRLGIERPPGSALVVTRTPPSGAAYHRGHNSLYLKALEVIARQPQTRCVVLTRRSEQRNIVASLELPDCTIPERATDARSLLFAADLVLGAGGTMTREAALIGVPTVSVFAGRPAAVEDWLEARGALRRLRSLAEVASVSPRRRPPAAPEQLAARGRELVELFVSETLAAANGGRG